MEKVVPQSITVDMDKRQKIKPLIDQFMREAKNNLMEAGGNELDFEEKRGGLSDGPNSVTDNAIAYLKHRDGVVVVVLETRTRLGRIRCDFLGDSEKAVPGSISILLDEAYTVQPKIDQFFFETVEAVRTFVQAKDSDFRVESGELALAPDQVTNERATFLKYRDQVVALVMATRTQFNNACFDFFRDLRGFRKPESK
jgi:hypothetical protein